MRKSTLPSLSTRRLVLPRPSAGNLVSCLVAACLGAIAHPAAADPAMPPSSQDFDFKPPFVVYAPSPGKTPAGKQKRPRAPMPGYCTNMPRPVTALATNRSEEHTSELQSLMRISYAVFCLKKKQKKHT